MYPSCRRAQLTPFDARRAVRFLLAAVVFARVPSELPTPGGPAAAPCEATSLRVVRLVVANEAGVAPEVLDAAAFEAGAIWARAGVRLTWTFAPTSFERMGADTVVVVIRRALRTPPVSESSEPSASHALGRISFGVDGRPANMIEVSLDALTGLVLAGVQFDRRIAKLPLANQRVLVGRGLGRVVAHELGHWLGGRGHVPVGVMKAGFDARDLVASITPLLPPAWRPLLTGALRTRGSRCEGAAASEGRAAGRRPRGELRERGRQRKGPAPPHTGGAGQQAAEPRGEVR